MIWIRTASNDVTTSFLNGELKEDIYMKQSEGYAENGKRHLVWKVKESTYMYMA